MEFANFNFFHFWFHIIVVKRMFGEIHMVERISVGYTFFNYVPNQLCKVTNFAGWKRCFRYGYHLGALVINPVLVNCWLILTQCENSC